MGKKKIATGVIVAIILGSIAIVIGSILLLSVADINILATEQPRNYELTETYEIPITIESQENDGIYSFKLELEDTFDGMVVTCGKDIPVGEYKLSWEETKGTELIIVDYQEESKEAGSLVYEYDIANGDVFMCEEGYEVDFYNGDGTFTFVSTSVNGDSEGDDTTDVEEITEKVTYEYNGDLDGNGRDDNRDVDEEDYVATCYSDDVVINCDDLHSETLLEDTMALYEEE